MLGRGGVVIPPGVPRRRIPVVRWLFSCILAILWQREPNFLPIFPNLKIN